MDNGDLVEVKMSTLSHYKDVIDAHYGPSSRSTLPPSAAW